jgi:RNA polymerase sigma factor for flagellar operon FliA
MMPIALSEAVQRRAPDVHDLRDEWRCYKAGSVAARNRLVAHYMAGHVRPIALRMRSLLPHHVDLEDLLQQGYLGLIDAMDRFDPERDVRFEVFSRRRIFGEILDYLRELDPLPRLSRIRVKRVEAACERFRVQHGRTPREEELAPLVEDVPRPILRRLLVESGVRATISFSSAQSEGSSRDDDADAMDGFADERLPAPHETAAGSDLRRWLTRGLDRRDRLIIILYYYEHLTMGDVGRAIGISESRVSQRLESILACLRARLRGEDELR